MASAEDTVRLDPSRVPVRDQMDLLLRGVADLVSAEELEERLTEAHRNGRPLRVKLGIDPSGADLTLGHTVPLRKLRQFQDLGHQAILLIGDFTGRIGDPTGRSETRRQLTEAEVRANAATYVDQACRVLDRTTLEVQFNSTWLAKLTFTDVIELAGRFTVARFLEREDFARRFEEGVPIHLHEFFYAIMQGYDSVPLGADVELGGTEQKFNLMTARDIQRAHGQRPEIALMLPVLEGTDGVRRMGKSLGNYIGIAEPPREQYGKTMSIPDHLIIKYFTLVTDVPGAEIRRLERGMADGSVHPRDAKMALARAIVRLYHGEEAARAAEDEFRRVFQERAQPEDIPGVTVPAAELRDGRISAARLLVVTATAPSGSEARRLVAQGGVELDGHRLTDPQAEVEVRAGQVLRVGKRRFVRLQIG